MCLADKPRTGIQQRLHRRCMSGRYRRLREFHRIATARAIARNIEQVLDPEGQARKRPLRRVRNRYRRVRHEGMGGITVEQHGNTSKERGVTVARPPGYGNGASANASAAGTAWMHRTIRPGPRSTTGGRA